MYLLLSEDGYASFTLRNQSVFLFARTMAFLNDK